MDLQELRASVSDMSQEELLDLLQQIRSNRRTPAEKPKPKRVAKKSQNVEKAMAELSSEDIASLLEALS